MKAIETINYKNHAIKIFFDETVENPIKEMETLGKFVCFHSRYDLGNCADFVSADQLKEFILKENPVYLNLFLYDHSGITMKASKKGNPFYGHLPQGHAEFDSGQVGIVFATKKDILKAYGGKILTKKLIEKVEKFLNDEVELSDRFMLGFLWRRWKKRNDQTGQKRR